MKLKEILQARRVLSEHVDDKICAPLAYKIMKILKSSDDDEMFYMDKLQQIVDKYGEHCEDGNILIPQSNAQKCKIAIAELEEIEVESPTIKFSLEELSGLTLSAKDMYILDSFIIA